MNAPDTFERVWFRGYIGNYQKEATARLDVSIYLFSPLQIPINKRGLKPGKKVGVICGVAPSLSPKILSQCGVDNLSDIVIAGAENQRTAPLFPVCR